MRLLRSIDWILIFFCTIFTSCVSFGVGYMAGERDERARMVNCDDRY